MPDQKRALRQDPHHQGRRRFCTPAAPARRASRPLRIAMPAEDSRKLFTDAGRHEQGPGARLDRCSAWGRSGRAAISWRRPRLSTCAWRAGNGSTSGCRLAVRCHPHRCRRPLRLPLRCRRHCTDPNSLGPRNCPKVARKMSSTSPSELWTRLPPPEAKIWHRFRGLPSYEVLKGLRFLNCHLRQT